MIIDKDSIRFEFIVNRDDDDMREMLSALDEELGEEVAKLLEGKIVEEDENIQETIASVLGPMASYVAVLSQSDPQVNELEREDQFMGVLEHICKFFIYAAIEQFNVCTLIEAEGAVKS